MLFPKMTEGRAYPRGKLFRIHRSSIESPLVNVRPLLSFPDTRYKIPPQQLQESIFRCFLSKEDNDNASTPSGRNEPRDSHSVSGLTPGFVQLVHGPVALLFSADSPREDITCPAARRVG